MIENPKNANISNKVKTNSGFHCFAFLFHASSHRPRLFSVWFELGNLGTKVRQSSPTQRSGFQFGCFCLDGGRLVVPGLLLVRSVGVRCGWVGARGWTAGCSPPSPWWSSEERTACWGTTGDTQTFIRHISRRSNRRHVTEHVHGSSTENTV